MINYRLCKARLSAAIFLTVLVTVTHAKEPVVSVQQKLTAIRSMSAGFTQTVNTKQRQLSQSSGTMALSRPNRFRWQTQKPMAQTVIADGKQVWVYDVDLEQVTVSKQTQQLGAVGALFLTQSNDAVAKDFNITSHTEGAIETFYLTAKSTKANFQQVTLSFKGPVLQSIALDDQLGQHTIARFSQIKINQPESDHLFTFSIPKGVDVIRK